jgi:hypothetical protein
MGVIWCISGALFVVLVFAYVWTFGSEEQSFGKRHLLLLIPMSAVPMLWLAVYVFAHKPRYIHVVDVILLFETISGLCAVIVLKRSRVFAVALLLLTLWVSMFCGLLATISISGWGI